MTVQSDSHIPFQKLTAANDEVGAAKVLTNDHVLNGFAGAGHVHRVRKVFPQNTGVGGFFLQHFISLVTDLTRNVIGLGRTARGVNQDDTAFSDKRVVKGTSEEFVVSTVNGVTALEGNNVLVGGEFGTDFVGGLAGEFTDGFVEAGNLSSHVVLSTFGGNHESTRVLDFGGTVALKAFHRLIRKVLVSQFNSGNGQFSLLEQDSGARHQALVVGIKDNRQTKDGSIGQFHVLDHMLVFSLFHEPS